MDSDRRALGLRIRRARERKLMSQADLAGAIGKSRAAVNSWENGRAHPRSSIGAIEAVLGINLTADDDQPPAITPANDDERQIWDMDWLPEDRRRDLILEYRARRRSRGELGALAGGT